MRLFSKCVASLLLAMISGAVHAAPPVNLADVASGIGGFAIVKDTSGDYTAALPAGDTNGDGLDDLLVGVSVYTSGRLFVALGRPGNDAILITDLDAGVGGFEIHSESSDNSFAARPAGDVNADGLDDIIIYNSYGPAHRTRSYVVFGKTNLAEVQLSDVARGLGGFIIDGSLEVLRAGGCGDFNGDGFDDVAVTQIRPGKVSSNVLVVFGKTDTDTVSLENLSGSGKGFRLTQGGAGLQANLSDGPIGDVNGDGYDDLIFTRNSLIQSFTGRSWVVFGRAGSSDIDLTSAENGQGGFLIRGSAASGHDAKWAGGTGDVNGDGLDDILISAPDVEYNGFASGRLYVVFGRTITTPLNLLSIDGSQGGFVADGLASGDKFGDWIWEGGDINADGLSDILAGAFNGSIVGIGINVGKTYAIYGKAGTERTYLDAIEIGSGGFVINGYISFGHASFPGSADVNGDGRTDVTVFGYDRDRSFVVHSPETPPLTLPAGIPAMATYRAHTRTGDGGGGGNVPPRKLRQSRLTIDYSDADFARSLTGASLETVTIRRTRSGVAGLGPLADIASSNWHVTTDRLGFLPAEITIKYLDLEISGISGTEEELAIYQGSSLAGPWVQHETTVNPMRNEASATVVDFGYFTIGRGGLAPTPTPTPDPTPPPTFTPTPTPTPIPTDTPTPTPSPTPTPVTYDFIGGETHGWIGGAVPGFGGTVSAGSSGLCMSVPATGENSVLWMSPEQFAPYVPDRLYKVRLHLSTDQSMPDAIPLFFFTYDNFLSSGEGNHYGGFFWILDVDGGAQGIGRPQGRTTFDFYVAPIAEETARWSELPAEDLDLLDMRFAARVIDANATVVSDNDSGMTCVSKIEISSIAIGALPAIEFAYAPPISNIFFFPQTADETSTGGTATIDDLNSIARYELPTEGDVRKTLGPISPGSDDDLRLRLFPVQWLSDKLMETTTAIRGEPEGINPIDAILISNDTATNELGASQYVTRGASGSELDRIGSPRPFVQNYRAYFYTQNTTASMTPYANRLRPLLTFFNSTNLGDDGTGGDEVYVESMSLGQFTRLP